MALMRLNDVHVSFGGPALLDGVDFSLEPGERVCLVGRNGAGKSTLMKLVKGQIKADSGSIVYDQGMKLAYLDQEVPGAESGSVYDVVAGGLQEIGDLLARYHHISHEMSESGDMSLMKQLEQIQHDLEAKHGWHAHQRIETLVSRLELDADVPFASLSGGMKRRVMLARALVIDPDLLLLDEPTNHLDIPSVEALEGFLKSYRGSLLFVTHDRAFLRALATRIVEIDRGKVHDYACDYDTYLKRRAEMLEAEAKENAEFDKKLAQEETWIRQGIKARRTRNEGRVRALKAMRAERAERRNLQGTAKMVVQEAQRSGKLVIETHDVGLNYEGRWLFRNLETVIQRGDKIGIIGPNGCGKTTLLNVLLGKEEPHEGKVKLGTRVELAYFDQLRMQLEQDKSVQDNVNEGRDKVTINGSDRHVISYLQDFLFTPDRARQPVSALSGGERNRLLLAKLFTKPSNVLVLDEPTNDLDSETLDLLEERLMDYDGTVLVVSHDRAFLDNVVTSSLVFDMDGTVREYVGGYSDWLRQRPSVQEPAKAETAPVVTHAKPAPKAKKPGKLSYKEQRELDALPQTLETLEQEQEDLHAQLADPSLYQTNPDKVTEVQARLAEVEAELEVAFERWEALEEKVAGLAE